MNYKYYITQLTDEGRLINPPTGVTSSGTSEKPRPFTAGRDRSGDWKSPFNQCRIIRHRLNAIM